jgi:hypothetical protein
MGTAAMCTIHSLQLVLRAVLKKSVEFLDIPNITWEKYLIE